jgi:hypothetical protein
VFDLGGITHFAKQNQFPVVVKDRFQPDGQTAKQCFGR